MLWQDARIGACACASARARGRGGTFTAGWLRDWHAAVDIGLETRLRALGATIEVKDGYIHPQSLSTAVLLAPILSLTYHSGCQAENLVMAAVLAKGIRFQQAAKEPKVNRLV